MRHEEDDHALVAHTTHTSGDYDDEEQERRDHGQKAMKQQEEKKVQEKKKKDQGRTKRLEPSFKWKVLNVHDRQESVHVSVCWIWLPFNPLF